MPTIGDIYRQIYEMDAPARKLISTTGEHVRRYALTLGYDLDPNDALTISSRLLGKPLDLKHVNALFATEVFPVARVGGEPPRTFDVDEKTFLQTLRTGLRMKSEWHRITQTNDYHLYDHKEYPARLSLSQFKPTHKLTKIVAGISPQQALAGEEGGKLLNCVAGLMSVVIPGCTSDEVNGVAEKLADGIQEWVDANIKAENFEEVEPFERKTEHRNVAFEFKYHPLVGCSLTLEPV